MPTFSTASTESYHELNNQASRPPLSSNEARNREATLREEVEYDAKKREEELRIADIVKRESKKINDRIAARAAAQAEARDASHSAKRQRVVGGYKHKSKRRKSKRKTRRNYKR